MPGFFPEPYEDELLYSLAARYHRRARYISKKYTSLELFGVMYSGATVDLPTRIEYLVSVLPPGHKYSADHIIDEHTLLPYYSAFLPRQRVETIREIMKSGGEGNVHATAGISNQSYKLSHLRYCSLCVQEDRKRYGETYWHRLHQLPGVEMCPKSVSKKLNDL